MCGQKLADNLGYVIFMAIYSLSNNMLILADAKTFRTASKGIVNECESKSSNDKLHPMLNENENAAEAVLIYASPSPSCLVNRSSWDPATHLILQASSTLRRVHHLARTRVHLRTRRASPLPSRLFTVLYLPFILHSNAATATTASRQVPTKASLELIQVPQPSSLHHGEQPPESTRHTHQHTMPIDFLETQQIRGIPLF